MADMDMVDSIQIHQPGDSRCLRPPARSDGRARLQLLQGNKYLEMLFPTFLFLKMFKMCPFQQQKTDHIYEYNLHEDWRGAAPTQRQG